MLKAILNMLGDMWKECKPVFWLTLVSMFLFCCVWIVFIRIVSYIAYDTYNPMYYEIKYDNQVYVGPAFIGESKCRFIDEDGNKVVLSNFRYKPLYRLYDQKQ